MSSQITHSTYISIHTRPQGGFQHLTINMRHLKKDATVGPPGRAEGRTSPRSGTTGSWTPSGELVEWSPSHATEKDKKHPQLYQNGKEMLFFFNLSIYFGVNLQLEPRNLPTVTESAWCKSSLSPINSLAASLTFFPSISYFVLLLVTETWSELQLKLYHFLALSILKLAAEAAFRWLYLT